MRAFFLTLGTVATVLFLAIASPAQLNPPNDMGVTVGHMHLNVHDVEAAKKFFLEIGGTAIKSGPFEGVKYPGVIFLFTKADPSGGTEGSNRQSHRLFGERRNSVSGQDASGRR